MIERCQGRVGLRIPGVYEEGSLGGILCLLPFIDHEVKGRKEGREPLVLRVFRCIFRGNFDRPRKVSKEGPEDGSDQTHGRRTIPICDFVEKDLRLLYLVFIEMNAHPSEGGISPLFFTAILQGLLKIGGCPVGLSSVKR